MEGRANLLFFASVASLFAGRALLSYFGNPALAEFFGFEGVVKPLVTVFMTWDQYGATVYPHLAEWLSFILSVLWFALFVGLWFPAFLIHVLRIGAILAFLEVCASLTGEYYWLLHQAARALASFTPFLVLLVIKRAPLGYSFGKVLIASVFAAHGVLALDILPMPGLYEDMFVILLGLDGDLAITTLRFVGVVDIVMAFSLLFLPKVPRITWIWLTGWGIITAMARLASYFEPSLPVETLGMGLGESLVRLCHGLVPWALSTRMLPEK